MTSKKSIVSRETNPRRVMKQACEIVAVASQKGGVGKTTTSVNLSAALARLNQKVLIIDMDPQGNTTSALGLDQNVSKYSVYNVLTREVKGKETVVNISKNLYIIPSDINLAAAEIELIDTEKREKILLEMVNTVRKKFDYVIIDCPPSLGLLTINALTAADSVLIPVQCEYFAMEGLAKLMKTIQTIQKKLNNSLTIKGILFTMYDKRNNLSHQVADEIKKYFGKLTYNTVIPRNVRLSECPSHGCSIFEYDKKSSGAKSYYNLAIEFSKKERK